MQQNGRPTLVELLEHEKLFFVLATEGWAVVRASGDGIPLATIARVFTADTIVREVRRICGAAELRARLKEADVSERSIIDRLCEPLYGPENTVLIRADSDGQPLAS